MPNCSLNCFLDFVEAKSSQRREQIIRDFKALQDKLADGMFRYHGPALSALRQRLVPGGTYAEQRSAISAASFKEGWTAERNRRRSVRDLSVFDQVVSRPDLFPATILPQIKHLYSAPFDVGISVCPDLSMLHHQRTRALKLGLRARPRTAEMVGVALQIMKEAIKPHSEPEEVCYFDTIKGEMSNSFTPLASINTRIAEECRELSRIWSLV